MSEESPVTLQIDPRWKSLVDPERLRRAALAALESNGAAAEGALTIVVVGDDQMTRLHEQYRATAGTTDVLSFPFEGHVPDQEMAGYLGDVVICYEQAARQARQAGHSAQDELDLLVVHGALHLLGHDDEEPAARARMWHSQRQILESLGLPGVAPDENDGNDLAHDA